MELDFCRVRDEAIDFGAMLSITETIKQLMKRDAAQQEQTRTHRRAAVAGMFYPAEPDTLRQTVQALLDEAPPAAGPVPKAMILPHAGYVYSGPVAAAACNLLRPASASIKWSFLERASFTSVSNCPARTQAGFSAST